MRTTALALALSSLLFLPTADALVRGRGEPTVVTAGRAQRDQRAIEPATRARMTAAGLPGWTAQLDRDTGVPLRMWGAGPIVPGAVANAAIAEAGARAFLASHLGLLAPGATSADFVVVGNRESHGIRSVGFEQRINGTRVVGGSISFAFQNDRLAMVGSTALPEVRVPAVGAMVSRTSALTSAQRWLATAGFTVRSRDAASLVSAPPVIVPLVRSRTARGLDISYHLAHELAVEDAKTHGRWAVWVDATTGKPIARRSTIMNGTGKITYEVPERTAQGTRAAFPAALATVVADGAEVTSNLGGDIAFGGTAPVDVSIGLTGPLVSVIEANGLQLTGTQQLTDGGSVRFSSADELGDAQLSAFIHANVVKQLAKRLDPDLAYLDQQLSVFVNENDVCNAFSTGDDIHFFKAGSIDAFQCENTARIADVVYHEFGHSWHINTSIPGVGAFHPSVSEGLADFTSVLITNDSGMGRGFFVDKPTEPLRELDPVGFEKKFPDNATGEPHDEGEILAGTLFDLDKALRGKLGAGPGRARTEKIFVTIMQRSVDLQSAYGEALLGDDDDGNLANGTPNQCEIDTAFAIHGLSDASVFLGLEPPSRDGFAFTASSGVEFTGACGVPLSVASVVVDWNLRGQSTQQVALTKQGELFTGAIPTQPDGSVIQYRIVYTLSNGGSVVFPSGNPAEPFLEFYVGSVRPIACFDFENGAQGWTHDGEWEAGTPAGLGGDPDVAFGGAGVFGLDLTQDGLYTSALPSFAESPEIDLKGARNVRLQYHRWLTVEDGIFDKARIVANGVTVWENSTASESNNFQLRNHTDREWRFSDLDLSEVAFSDRIKLRFELESDPALELGGWTVDDVCIVEAVASGCGNGVVEQGEACDDGNTTGEDGCSATCAIEDGVDPTPDDGGCCSTGGSPVAPAGFAMLIGLGLLRRRRRAA